MCVDLGFGNEPDSQPADTSNQVAGAWGCPAQRAPLLCVPAQARQPPTAPHRARARAPRPPHPDTERATHPPILSPQDLFYITILAALMGYTDPVPTLARSRPPPRVLSLPLIMSLVLQIAAVVFFQVGRCGLRAGVRSCI